MKTNKDNIYAAGDIVTFPLFIADDEQANVQHWQMAHTHGKEFTLHVQCSMQTCNLLHKSDLFYFIFKHVQSVRIIVWVK